MAPVGRAVPAPDPLLGTDLYDPHDSVVER